MTTPTTNNCNRGFACFDCPLSDKITDCDGRELRTSIVYEPKPSKKYVIDCIKIKKHKLEMKIKELEEKIKDLAYFAIQLQQGCEPATILKAIEQ